MIKKVISLFLSVSILFCLSACEEQNDSNTTTIVQENESISNSSTIKSTSESSYKSEIASSTEVKLSDSCDKVLASGYDAENNYYELVANETEDYNGLVVEVGAIKNNVWVFEPTTDMPFVNNISSFGNGVGEVNYIGKGCFISAKAYSSGAFSPTHYLYIVYNVNNGKYYSTEDYRWEFKNKVPIINSNTDDCFLIGYENYSTPNFIILNKNDMNTKTFSVEGQGSLYSYGGISEGVFSLSFGSSSYPSYAFYDANGNKVLDLAKYKTPRQEDISFYNGKCTFKIINDNGTGYYITIDKSGNVVDSILA